MQFLGGSHNFTDILGTRSTVGSGERTSPPPDDVSRANSAGCAWPHPRPLAPSWCASSPRTASPAPSRTRHRSSATNLNQQSFPRHPRLDASSCWREIRATGQPQRRSIHTLRRRRGAKYLFALQASYTSFMATKSWPMSFNQISILTRCAEEVPASFNTASSWSKQSCVWPLMS